MLLDVNQVTIQQSRAQTQSNDVLRPGESLTATVKQVSQNNLSSGVFRLQVEANQQMLELSTKQPIATGSQITLSRDSAGQYSIQVSNQASSQTTGANPQSTTTAQQASSSAAQTSNVTPQTTGQVTTTLTVPAKWASISVSQTPLAPTTPTNPATQGTAASASTQGSGAQPSTVPTPVDVKTAQSLLLEGQTVQAKVIQQIATSVAANVASNNPTGAAQAQALTQNLTPINPQFGASQATAPTAPATTPTTLAAQVNTAAQGAGLQAGLTQASPNTAPQPSTQTVPNEPLINRSAQASQPQNTQDPSSATSRLQAKALNAYGAQPPTSTLSPSVSQPTVNTSNSGTLLTVQIQNQTAQLVTPTPLPNLTEVTLKQENGQLSVQFPTSALTAAKTESAKTTPVLNLTPSQQASVDQALKQALPLQQPLAENLQTLSNIMSQSGGSSNVDKAIQSLLNAFGVTPGSQGSETNIRNNVQMGGMFTEARLAQQLPVQGDMKQFLGQLQTLSDGLPSNQQAVLQKAIDSMSARITQQQITQVNHRQDRVDTGERFFQLDLPVRFQEAFENVEMRVQQRDAQNTQGEWSTLWRVRLHFDLGEEGKMDADISLNQQEHTINAMFACTSDNTAQEVRTRLSGFDQQLKSLGFESTQLTCRQGNLARQTQAINKQLIDVKT